MLYRVPGEERRKSDSIVRTVFDMKCGNCGAEIKYGEKVCPGCGLPLPKSNYDSFKEEMKPEDSHNDSKSPKDSIKDKKKSSQGIKDERQTEDDADVTVDIAGDSDDGSKDEKKKKNTSEKAIINTERKQSEEDDDIIDAEFKDIDDEAFKAPSTKIRTKHKLTKGDIATIIIGIVMLIALVIAGIVYFVKKQNNKKVQDNKFGQEEVMGFFDGISMMDEIASYDYITGNNADAIYKIVDDRIRFGSSFRNFEISDIEITEKKELKGSFLDSMINKTGADLDRSFILNITFRYNADGVVLPAKAIIRTGRTKTNKKWWVVSADFDDAISAAQDFMSAYSKVDAETIIDSFADGVLSEKDREAMRKSYQYIIAPFNFTDVKLNAYKVPDDKLSQLAEGFADQNRKYSSVIGFNVETYGKNSDSSSNSNRADFDLVMALDGSKWKVLDIQYIPAE